MTFKEYQQENNGVRWRDWVDLRFEELDKRSEAARREMERRLETMNEFREQLNKQAGTFVTREYADSKFDAMIDKMESMQKVAAAALIAIIVAITVFLITGR